MLFGIHSRSKQFLTSNFILYTLRDIRNQPIKGSCSNEDQMLWEKRVRRGRKRGSGKKRGRGKRGEGRG